MTGKSKPRRGANPPAAVKTANDSKERRRLLYRVTKVAELVYVMLCLPALFYINFLELPGFAFGLAGFLVLIGGGIILNDFHTRPDYAPATKPLAWRGFLALGLGIPALLWLRLGEMPWIGWANLAGGPILAWLDYCLRPASNGGLAEFSPVEMARPATQPRTPERLSARQPGTPGRRSP
jgi:hypothetical protein